MEYQAVNVVENRVLLKLGFLSTILATMSLAACLLKGFMMTDLNT